MTSYYAVSGDGTTRFSMFLYLCQEGVQWDLMSKCPPPSERTKDVVYLLSESNSALLPGLNLKVFATTEPILRDIKAYIEGHWKISLVELDKDTEMIYLDAESIP